MSHASGEIWSTDGKLLAYFEYDGTADICCTRLHSTQEGVRLNWRKDNKRECTCSAAGQSVTIYTDYGAGWYWSGKVCWHCMCITAGISPPDDEHKGHPFPELS